METISRFAYLLGTLSTIPAGTCPMLEVEDCQLLTRISPKLSWLSVLMFAFDRSSSTRVIRLYFHNPSSAGRILFCAALLLIMSACSSSKERYHTSVDWGLQRRAIPTSEELQVLQSGFGEPVAFEEEIGPKSSWMEPDTSLLNSTDRPGTVAVGRYRVKAEGFESEYRSGMMIGVQIWSGVSHDDLQGFWESYTPRLTRMRDPYLSLAGETGTPPPLDFPTESAQLVDETLAECVPRWAENVLPCSARFYWFTLCGYAVEVQQALVPDESLASQLLETVIAAIRPRLCDAE